MYSSAQHGGTARHDRATRSRTEILQAIRLSYLSRGKSVTFVSRVRLFFSPSSIFSISLPLFYLSGLVFFLSFFFFASVPHITINNLSKAVNREIDRRSSRKLLLRCIRLKVLFIRVSRNLFVRGTCFRRTMQSRLTRAEIPPRKLNKSRRRRAGCGGGKNWNRPTTRAPRVTKGIRVRVW